MFCNHHICPLCLIQKLAKRLGKGMYEWAAKVDEYARGMIGPPGSTLFEELGLYYIGPVDGHNIEDLICVLREVASLDSTGPVLVHVITKEEREVQKYQKSKTMTKHQEGVFPDLIFFIPSQMSYLKLKFSAGRAKISLYPLTYMLLHTLGLYLYTNF